MTQGSAGWRLWACGDAIDVLFLHHLPNTLGDQGCQIVVKDIAGMADVAPPTTLAENQGKYTHSIIINHRQCCPPVFLCTIVTIDKLHAENKC